jgi:hypothetical protein
VRFRGYKRRFLTFLFVVVFCTEKGLDFPVGEGGPYDGPTFYTAFGRADVVLDLRDAFYPLTGQRSRGWGFHPFAVMCPCAVTLVYVATDLQFNFIETPNGSLEGLFFIWLRIIEF